MINTEKRDYNFYQYEYENNYGQAQLSDKVKGQIKMAIYSTNQSTQDNIRYKDATYVGITHNRDIDDTFVIQYGEEKLKVLYANKQGRSVIAFMKNI
jgi:hypothetical protein